MKYWDEKHECMSRDEMTALQSERLKDMLNRVYKDVPFYKKKMDDVGILPGDVKGIEDLKNLPFTTKQDLRDHYPFEMFAKPMTDVIRVHASSGTTGKPTVVGYTAADIDMWANLVARNLVATGATKDWVIQVAYGYGLFTGGLGVHYGVEKLGATVVPISGGNTKKQIMLMQDFKTNLLACTPSYMLYISEVLDEMGINVEDLNLKVGLFGAEPWTNSMRKQIEEKMNIHAIDIYGLSEIIGPGVACECTSKCGLHVSEDHFIPEIINPKTFKSMNEGEKGELVFTTVTKQALPLLRYRTKDISSLNSQKCECGRTLARMDRVSGRTDDMLIIRGVNVFPSQIESVLLDMGDTAPHYQLIVDRMGALDVVEIQVEMSNKIFSDEIKGLESIEKKIKHEIESVLGVSAKIRLVEPKTIPRSEGKAKRVIDKRKKG